MTGASRDFDAQTARTSPRREVRAVVCLHAAASGPATWEPVRAGLGATVHCPALPGHPGGPRLAAYPLTAFRDAVLEELRNLDRVVLIGHSLGAFVASMVAMERPEQVERLVLEEMPVPRRSDKDEPPARKRLPGLAMRALAMTGGGKFDPVMLRDVLRELREPQPDWWAGLARITAPTLILAGGPASHLDQSRYELLAEVLPEAKRATIAVGHRIHTKAPAEWLAAVTG